MKSDFFILLNVHNLHAFWKLPEDPSHSISFWSSLYSFILLLYGGKEGLFVLVTYIACFLCDFSSWKNKALFVMERR